jgi:hypothetical protein
MPVAEQVCVIPTEFQASPTGYLAPELKSVRVKAIALLS